MFNRGLFLLFLAGAVAVPYALSATRVLEKLGVSGSSAERPADEAGPFDNSGWSADSDRSGTAGSASPAGQAPLAAIDAHPGSAEDLLLVPRPQALYDVFRFDITTAEVLGRWPRVTTQVAGLELQGFRVPLVTGTQADDLAGSLTYYFNKDQRLQRIVFFGTTGDARKLVALLAQQYGFTRKLTDDPGLYLYQVRRGRKAESELRINAAKVIKAEAPHTRFEVALWIERPQKS